MVDTIAPIAVAAPPKQIVLEKIAGDPVPSRYRHLDGARLGTVFTYTYKHLNHDQALQRASKMLEHVYPTDKRLNWKEIA